MGIVITKTGDSVYLDYGGNHNEFHETDIGAQYIRSVNRCLNDEGVRIIFSSLNSTLLHYSVIDSVGGDTDITSNQKLFDALRALRTA